MSKTVKFTPFGLTSMIRDSPSPTCAPLQMTLCFVRAMRTVHRRFATAQGPLAGTCFLETSLDFARNAPGECALCHLSFPEKTGASLLVAGVGYILSWGLVVVVHVRVRGLLQGFLELEAQEQGELRSADG